MASSGSQSDIVRVIRHENPCDVSFFVRELLESGADPNGVDELCGGVRPVYAAWELECEHSESGVVDGLFRLLVDHGAKAFVGEGQLERLSLDQGTVEHTVRLFELGHSFCELVNDGVVNGSNPLELMLRYDRIELIEAMKRFDVMCLLEGHEWDFGLTPLGAMARDGQIDKVRWCLGHGANVNAFCERLVGYTALDEAVMGSNLEMVSLLILHGADPHIPTDMAKDGLQRAERQHERHPNETTKAILKLVRKESAQRKAASRRGTNGWDKNRGYRSK